ncbi:MAG TPA: hypothetical protein PLR06_09185 [Cyclobacteriaceae bacterium]|nr:hypothetical protein [Cyclobacteriaceae bacterium]
MLIKALGPAYVVWDKTAHIRFKKPAKTTLYAVLKISADDLVGIRNMVKECGHATKTFSIRWLDKDQVIHAEIERQCYVADKEFYVRKKGDTQTARF